VWICTIDPGIWEGRVLNEPTSPERILAAAQRELSLALQRLIACRNRLYRETGTYPEDLGAAIFRLDFVLHHLMSGPSRAVL